MARRRASAATKKGGSGRARRRASAATNLQNAERMRQHQPRRVPIHTHPPFLHEPAEFGSPRTLQQLTQSQAGQIIAIPPPKRLPSVIDLAEVVGAQYVQEITQSGQLVFQSAGDSGFGGRGTWSWWYRSWPWICTGRIQRTSRPSSFISATSSTTTNTILPSRRRTCINLSSTCRTEST